jgi:hypothetical protein
MNGAQSRDCGGADILFSIIYIMRQMAMRRDGANAPLRLGTFSFQTPGFYRRLGPEASGALGGVSFCQSA